MFQVLLLRVKDFCFLPSVRLEAHKKQGREGAELRGLTGETYLITYDRKLCNKSWWRGIIYFIIILFSFFFFKALKFKKANLQLFRELATKLPGKLPLRTRVQSRDAYLI